MNEARFNAVYSGLTSIARKVYDATPIASEWTASAICAELRRNGINVNLKTVQGCLSSLIGSGLVDERKLGHFIRTPVRAAKTVTSEMKTVHAMSAPQENLELPLNTKTPAARTPIDELAELMAEAEKISNDAKKLAENIIVVGSRVEEQMAKDRSDLARLRQLQNLLKELG